jgi:hypothetical protein
MKTRMMSFPLVGNPSLKKDAGQASMTKQKRRGGDVLTSDIWK